MFAGYVDEILIGEGGLGRVYRATKVSTGGSVAVKELRDVAQGSPAWHRARRELDALLRLKGHPHVVSVEEIVDGPNGPCIVMEFAPGGSLMDRLASGPLGVPELILVGQQVALALGAAHEVGIIHRDIKPHNLLVAAFGQVKVCDFGIAAVTRGNDGRTQTQALTLAYASPEELDGELQIGPATDVYSFAATMEHLATGRKPSFQERMSGNAIGRGWPAAQEPFMQPVLEAMRQSMAHRPESRPTVDELGNILDAAAVALGARRLRRLPLRTQTDVERSVIPSLAASPHVESSSGGEVPDATVVRWPAPLLPVPILPAAALPPRAVASSVQAPSVLEAATVVRRPAAMSRQTRPYPIKAGSPRLIHTPSEVLSAAFCPAGGRLVTSQSDGSVAIWDVGSATVATTFRGHRGDVFSAGFSPDGLVVVSAGADGRTILWEVASGDQLGTFTGHRSATYAAALSPDGGILVTDGDDERVILWDVEAGDEIGSVPGHIGDSLSAAFHPESTAVVTTDDQGTAVVWGMPDVQTKAVLKGHDGDVFSAAFSPDGLEVVTAGSDGRVIIWEWATARQRAVLHGHTGVVYSAMFSADGSMIISAGGDGVTILWSAEDGAELCRIDTGHDGVSTAALNADASVAVIVGADGSAHLWALTPY